LNCPASTLPPCSSSAAEQRERDALIERSHELAVTHSNLSEVLEDLHSFLRANHCLEPAVQSMLDQAYLQLFYAEKSLAYREQQSVEDCERAGVMRPEHSLCPEYFRPSCEQAPMRVFIDSYVVDVEFGGMSSLGCSAVATFARGSQRLLSGSRHEVARSLLGIMLQKDRR